MNTLQKKYAATVALVDVLRNEEKPTEREVIKEMNLTDESGSPIHTLYMIEDEAVFKEACDLLESKLAAVRYTARLGKALEEKSKAAESLIEWSLKTFEAIYPTEAKQLKENSKRYKIRERLIELAMQM